MIGGCIKLMDNEKILRERYYYDRKSRTEIFEEFTIFIKKYDRELFIHVIPVICFKTEYISSKENFKKEIRLRHIDGLIPDREKEKIIRLEPKYSNHNNIQQYFD